MSNSDTREDVCGLLARADAERITELADRILSALPDPSDCAITRAPQVGTVQIQVREPIAHHRFILADAIATNVEVRLRGQGGWGLRLGDDTVAATAQAICDAEYAAAGPLADEVSSLAVAVRREELDARAAEWRDLQPTIVEFEEIA